MSHTAIQRVIDTWDEPLRKLHRLNVLCELVPEVAAGEKVREVAEMTGVADALPQTVDLDYRPARVLARKELLSRIWNLCGELSDINAGERVACNLNQVPIMAAMLYSRREAVADQAEVESIAEVLEQDHTAVLDEIGMEVPDPESSAAVYGAVERLLAKYSRKALNAWTTKRR